VSAVPEPSTLTIGARGGLALVGYAASRRRRKSAN
jgi:MYXO-CTERM domain-containing protein